MKTIFERSRTGRGGLDLKNSTGFDESWIPEQMRAGNINLPEVDELTLTRHYTNLSKLNFSVDANFYPLGSCTMKYNPKLNEKIASLEGFSQIHPLLPEEHTQGILRLSYELAGMLAEISGLKAVTLQPAAGSHGELTGLMIASAYLKEKGEKDIRTEILIPDSAHGTNPASAALCGFKAVEVKSGSNGLIDMDDFYRKLCPATAAMMITNPNTLGLFEERIRELSEALHKNGSLLYMDGANFNAIMDISRPGDFGVDIMHFNLHKTFSTPHGGGGPGSGPVGVKPELEQYLPVPVVSKKGDRYMLDYERPASIGKVRALYGNVPVFVRAYVYLKTLGRTGIRQVSENAVLNANYLMARLKDDFEIPYNADGLCMHEFVISAENLKKKYNVRALDIAKALIDRDTHPPTVYFPLIVPEAIMIEPTETESLETLDEFVNNMIEILNIAKSDPESLHQAPCKRTVSRPDELTAAREPVLKHEEKGE